MITRALAMVAVLAFAGAAFAAPPTAPSFDYVVRQTPVTQIVTYPPAPGVTVTAVVFESDGRLITGELIQAAGAGPHPAVLWAHWLGEPKTTNHTEFETDAVAMAQSGVTSLLIDEPWSKRGWFGPLGTDADADLRSSAEAVVDMRRALDLLLAQPGVDPRRIAFVGHDFGAMFGMLMASVDHRPSWYVLMAPNSSIGEWYLWDKAKSDRAAYLERLGVLDVPAFLAKARAKGFLLQFSAHDIYITAANQQAIVSATPQPHEVKVYDVDHSLETPAAHEDRLAWLKARLLTAH